jgi:hypothetical protein
VALLLGLSDAAVRKRLSRARAAVRGELLGRFGEFARGSAPAAGFAVVVTSALTVAAPPAAAGTLLTVSGTVGAKSLAKLLLGALGSAGIGIAGGVLGIWWGLKRNLRGAIDARERAEIKRSARITGIATVAFLVGMVVYAQWGRGWVPPTLLAAAFFGIVFHQSMVVEPRIKARRHALEALRDPVKATRCRRRERILAWTGCIVGLACGGGGLVYGLIASNRLPF